MLIAPAAASRRAASPIEPLQHPTMGIKELSENKALVAATAVAATAGTALLLKRALR